jgi:hypothetical protein
VVLPLLSGVVVTTQGVTALANIEVIAVLQFW